MRNYFTFKIRKLRINTKFFESDNYIVLLCNKQTWYYDPLPMVYRPTTHIILNPTLCILTHNHGILTPYPWEFDPHTHGISNPYPWYCDPLPMVLKCPYPLYFDPYPWYIVPTIYGIFTPLPMVF